MTVNDPERDPSVRVHPTAVVESGARLGAGVVIHAHAVVTRHCVLGEQVVVHPFAVLGGDPQDLHFDPSTETGVIIGPGTTVREHVTVNRATRAGAATQVGANCFLMAASHVAHDCRVGSRVIVANAVLLGGHVDIGDRAFLGGGAVIHQFCRVGEDAMIGGGSRISQDVAPYCMVVERNSVVGLNVVGLRRRGVKRDVFQELKLVFRIIDSPVGNAREAALELSARSGFRSEEAGRFLQFFANGRRGFARTRRSAGNAAEDEGG